MGMRKHRLLENAMRSSVHFAVAHGIPVPSELEARFNPNHDESGRFAEGSGAGGMAPDKGGESGGDTPMRPKGGMGKAEPAHEVMYQGKDAQGKPIYATRAEMVKKAFAKGDGGSGEEENNKGKETLQNTTSARKGVAANSMSAKAKSASDHLVASSMHKAAANHYAQEGDTKNAEYHTAASKAEDLKAQGKGARVARKE